MSVIVSFCTPYGIGNDAAPGVRRCRVRETLTVPATTTATVQDGEVVLISSTESATILAAHGTTPDAQATAETAATSAGYPIPAGTVEAVVPATGDKINVKALA